MLDTKDGAQSVPVFRHEMPHFADVRTETPRTSIILPVIQLINGETQRQTLPSLSPFLLWEVRKGSIDISNHGRLLEKAEVAEELNTNPEEDLAFFMGYLAENAGTTRREESRVRETRKGGSGTCAGGDLGLKKQARAWREVS